MRTAAETNVEKPCFRLCKSIECLCHVNANAFLESMQRFSPNTQQEIKCRKNGPRWPQTGSHMGNVR
jgi:hypothetical protein